MRPLTMLVLLAGCDDTLFGVGEPRIYSPDWDGVTALLADECTLCHDAGSAIVLPDDIVADVVNSERAYVVPFDPETSLLWRLLAGTAEGDFATMPLDQGALPEDSIEHVRAWIAEGAPIDGAVCDGILWYPDADGDGFGTGTPTSSCTRPDGYASSAGDCDDGDAAWHPGADEPCASTDDLDCDGSVGIPATSVPDVIDGIDNDCDGDVDEDGTLSLAADVQPIFDDACSSCHDPPAPAGGLDTSGQSWDDLVDVPSDDVPSMDLVEPFDPDRSYLWYKLIGTQQSVGGVGTRMPKGDPALDAETLAIVRGWILGGAAP